MNNPSGEHREAYVVRPDVHQLFIDDALIAVKENIRRTLHQPAKSADNPIMRPQLPCEGDLVILYGTVLFDDDEGVFRMWHQTRASGAGKLACYATSQDGLHWERPLLGVTEVLGSRENNVIFSKQTHPYYDEMHSVVKDPDDPDPQRRYKMTFCGFSGERGTPDWRRDYYTATSPDGIRWTAREDYAIRFPENAADISHFIKDPISGKYIIWCRTRYKCPGVEARWPEYTYGRAVARAESSDFINWTQPKTIFHADEQDPIGSEIYTMGAFPYEGMYVGMVQMYHAMRHECTLDIQLASSRDGWHWDRVADRSTWLPCGGVGEWDRFNQSVAGRPVVMGDELWFYYAGRTNRHTPYAREGGRDSGEPLGAIGLATLRRDGFCSMNASFDGGRLTTVPLQMSDGDLHLNVKSDFGQVQVELLAENLERIPDACSAPVRANACDVKVGFPEGFSPASVHDQPVRLRFSLSNARLFSFWTAESRP